MVILASLIIEDVVHLICSIWDIQRDNGLMRKLAVTHHHAAEPSSNNAANS